VKILLIGFGSIGSRHYKLLNKNLKVKKIDIVSGSKPGALFTHLTELNSAELANYDLFFICSETSLHEKQLQYIDKKVVNKVILIEKPLFSEKSCYVATNRVLVAYNLRFHPVIQKLKHILKGKKLLAFSVSAGQYLPTWRPEQDYKISYSSELTRGGGVLRDLSHEIDYTFYLCGQLKLQSAMASSHSHLQIKSDDLCTILATNYQCAHVQIQMDYLSFRPKREIEIQTDDMTISANLISNEIIVYYDDGKVDEFIFEDLMRDFTYQAMHADVIENSGGCVTNFTEANQIVLLIDNITEHFMDKSWT
jgi:CMP-N,N'-diacetyllegionaminic acid synthase